MSTDWQEVKQLWIKRHHFAEFCFAGKGEWGWVGGLATRCLTVYAWKRALGQPVRHSPQLSWSLPDVSGRKWCRNVGQPPQQDVDFFFSVFPPLPHSSPRSPSVELKRRSEPDALTFWLISLIKQNQLTDMLSVRVPASCLDTHRVGGRFDFW